MEAARSASESRFEALRRRKEQQELEAVEAIQNMERAHMKAAEELEALYEKKLAIEAQRYRALLHEKEDMECSYEEQLEITKSKYNSVIMKLKGEFEAKTKEQQVKILKRDSNSSEENLSISIVTLHSKCSRALTFENFSGRLQPPQRRAGQHQGAI